jgi:hypothetical protein
MYEHPEVEFLIDALIDGAAIKNNSTLRDISIQLSILKHPPSSSLALSLSFNFKRQFYFK